jgi:hypothetical protein
LNTFDVDPQTVDMRIIKNLLARFSLFSGATTSNTIATMALFILFSINPGYSCTEDPSVKLTDLKTPDGLDVCIQPFSAIDATVTIDLKMENLVSSAGNDFTCDLHNYRQRNLPYGLTHLHVIDPTRGYKYHYDFHYRIGNLSGHPDTNYVYELPYQKGEHHRINQGYFGAFSHQIGSDTEYALDFDMPVGTVVCAAREGICVAARTDSTNGGPDPAFKICANHVEIRHADGTYAEYVHLRTNGAIVHVGDVVKVGQPIAYSGNTGFSQGPHMHFAVYIPRDGIKVQSMPTKFHTDFGISNSLQQGQVY